MLWGRALTLLFVAVAAGCPAPDTFQCVSDAQCGDGVCEANEYCSFPDGMCDSGRRYGSEAATGIAGQCVPVDVGSTTSVGGSTSAPGSVTTTFSTSDGSSVGESSGSSSSWGGGGLSTGSTGTGSTTWPGTSSTTSYGESSSTGAPVSCGEVGVCDECFVCEGQPGNACDAEQAACGDEDGCQAIFQCLSACATTGLCIEDCCEGFPQSAAAQALAQLDCKQDACIGEACPSFASTVCNGP